MKQHLVQVRRLMMEPRFKSESCTLVDNVLAARSQCKDCVVMGLMDCDGAEQKTKATEFCTGCNRAMFLFVTPYRIELQ